LSDVVNNPTQLERLRAHYHGRMSNPSLSNLAETKVPGPGVTPGTRWQRPPYAPTPLALGRPLISMRRGSAAAVIGAVISSKPFWYSALIFSVSTPSGRVSVRSNVP